MNDANRQFNGSLIEGLCRMSDEILRGFGIPPERAKVEYPLCRKCKGTGLDPCDGCGGSGLVPANSGSDVADFRCQECNGKGVRP